MAEKPADKPQESSKQALDLNTLSGLDFGPSWADKNAKRPSLKQFDFRGDSRGKGKRTGGAVHETAVVALVVHALVVVPHKVAVVVAHKVVVKVGHKAAVLKEVVKVAVVMIVAAEVVQSMLCLTRP